MTALLNVVGAVNTAALAGLAINQMALEAKLSLLSGDDPGGAGRPTFVDPAATAGGDGSQARPFNTLDEAAAKINLDGAGFAALTGTPAELAAALRPAVVYLAPGAYTQTVAFAAPTIVVPTPGVTVPTLSWAIPVHTSTATAVPWAAGVIMGDNDGGDPITIGALAMANLAPTAGGWAPSMTLKGPVSRAGSVAAVTSTGPTLVAMRVDSIFTGAIAADQAVLVATESSIASCIITGGSAQLDEVFCPGAFTIAGLSTLRANDSRLTGGVSVGNSELSGGVVAGALVGDFQIAGVNVVSVTSVTGNITRIDTTGWAQLAEAPAVVPTGTVTLYGTTGGNTVAGVSPQVIPFGVVFPSIPRGVQPNARAVTADATTFASVTAVTTTTFTVRHGGVGAGAPTSIDWLVTM